MGLLSIIGAKQRVQFIQNATNTLIEMDCSVSESHKRESPATEFELESGLQISDHIIVKPISLEITGIISDTPIGLKQLGVSALTTGVTALLPPVGVIAAGAVGSALSSALGGGGKRSVTNYQQLVQLQERRQPFDVLTTLQRYSNMWITNLTVPRDASTGQALYFTVSLSRLILVSPQTVNIKKLANPPVSASQADAGKQQAKDKALSAAQQGKVDGLILSGRPNG